MTKQIISRFNSPTPKIVKKLQKIAAAIGGSGVVVTASIAVFSDFTLPSWVPMAIGGAAFLNHVLLNLFTESDNE
jgi:hypothetical protein